MTIFLVLAALQDVWLPISVDGAPTPRRGHTAVWTGREMIVWGGEGDGGLVNDGSAYDPITAVWRPISGIGAPEAQTGHVAVWTGSEMIVWGTNAPARGGRYNPAADTWTSMSTTGAPLTVGLYGAVWTGIEMIVWGSAGGRYNPQTDSWTPTANGPGLPAGIPSTFSWTGTRMIVLSTGTSSRYDPVTDTWAVITTTGAPVFGVLEGAWTGSELIVMGSGPSNVPEALRYDPVGDVWTTISGAPHGLMFHRVVWSGREAIGWGRHPFGGSAGNTFDPVTNEWPAMASSGQPGSRTSFTMVWAGDSAIVWGGRNPYDTPLDTGGIYYPNGSGRVTSLDTGCLAATGGAGACGYLAGALFLGAAFLLRRRLPTLLTFLLISGSAWAQDGPSEKRDESKPPAPQEPAPAPVVEEEGPTADSDPFLIAPSLGLWFNGFRFQANTPTGVRTLDAGAMPTLGLRGGFFLADPVFVQLSLEAAFGEDVMAFTAGVDVGWRFALGEWSELRDVLWELDLYAGGLVSRLDLSVDDFAEFDAGTGFRLGASVRARLNPDLAVEGGVEFRSLTYAWDGTGTGDDEARANGAALLMGLRWKF